MKGPPGNFESRSPIAEFRTAIADDVLEPLTVTVSSCNGNSLNWPALDLVADEYYDMFLHLGDMAYNDGAFSLPEFREKWRQFLGASGFRKAYARAGLYATWDDHEIDDNSRFDRETMDPMQLEKRQNAMDAYFEVLPIDAEGPNYRLWRSFRWGLTAEIIVLDCRYERRPSLGQYMSEEQMEWLKERLLESPCHFKIIMNSVPITNMPFAWGVASSDRWEGFPASRNELLGFINEHQIENIWFLAGDFHVCFVSRLEPNVTSHAATIHEIAVTGGNENPISESILAMNPPQFAYGTRRARALLITFDPQSNAVNVRFIHPSTGEDDYNESLSYG
jgi:phosphodiesterase/alkaline phosphatase D-like protein